MMRIELLVFIPKNYVNELKENRQGSFLPRLPFLCLQLDLSQSPLAYFLSHARKTKRLLTLYQYIVLTCHQNLRTNTTRKCMTIGQE